ncbi:MAG TPA: glycosyl hydrolase family 18 protein [Bacillota bacterium]|nr:glycosyl hydrolase family 18 protein [Bacillota bacterium]
MRKRLVIIVLLMIPLLGCNNIKPDSDPINEFYVAAWYPTYDSARGLKSFTDHLDVLNEINPVWYNLNPAYFTSQAAPLVQNLLNHDTIFPVAKYAGIKVLPTIQNFGATNFDRAVIGQIIQDAELRKKHVQEIVDLVKTEDYDGIDIDYENLVFNDRPAFSAFIAELGQALHQEEKQLSVTVYAKTSGAATWTGPGAQDWAALASSVDSLKVMVYDYHWAAFRPGPISPLDWLEAILKYADTIPEARGKIVIGLPFYGLDWAGVWQGGVWNGSTAKEKTYQDAMNLLSQFSGTDLNRNDADHSSNQICGAYSKNAELHFQYQNSGVQHTVYYQDSETLRRRLEIIGQYPQLIKGVTFWRLGGEDPQSWDELKKFRANMI